MNISDQEYKLLAEMIEEDINRQISWLRTKADPNYKLFNAGQIKAFQHVLELLAVTNDSEAI